MQQSKDIKITLPLEDYQNLLYYKEVVGTQQGYMVDTGGFYFKKIVIFRDPIPEAMVVLKNANESLSNKIRALSDELNQLKELRRPKKSNWFKKLFGL